MRISDWSSDVCSSDLKEPHSTKATVYCAAGVYLHGRDRIAESLEYYSVADAINAQLPHSPLSVESCFRMSGHAHLNQGQLHTALEHLDRSCKIHELHGLPHRSEARRVGKECVSQCRSR